MIDQASEQALVDFLRVPIKSRIQDLDTEPEFVDSTGGRPDDGWGSRVCPVCGHEGWDGTEAVTKEAWWEHVEGVHHRVEQLALYAVFEKTLSRAELSFRSPQRYTGPGAASEAMAYRRILLDLAQVYSSREGYRPEWASL